MKEKLQMTYYCDFCKKMYVRKSACETHEKGCSHNPENDRKCFGCKHLKRENIDRYFDTYIGEQSEQVSVFYCEKLDTCLYPPKVEAKGNAFEFGDINNIPMKSECEHFEDYIFEF